MLGVSGVAALAPAASAKDFAQVVNGGAALAAPGVGGSARLAGADRYATAATVALATYPAGGKNDVVLATGANFPDGLAAAGLAGAVDTPVLLTDTNALPTVTINALASLTSGTAKRVHIIGGTSAISQTVRTQLTALGYTLVENYNGANRADTAAKVATGIGTANIGGIGAAGLRTAILATGGNYADALAAGSLSFAAKLPILLTDNNTLSPETASAITALGIKQVIIMGGTSAVSAAVATSVTALGVTVVRMAGADRADTAVQLANYADLNGAGFGFNRTRAVLFNGYESFADGLSAGPHAGKLGATLLPVSTSSVPTAVASYLAANKATLILIQAIGGTAVIPDTVLTSAIASASIASPTATITATANASTATVVFSEAVTPGTVTPATFQILSAGGTAVLPLPGGVTQLTPTTFRLALSAPLLPGDIIRLAQNPAPGAQVGISAITTPAGAGVAIGTGTTIAADVTRPSATITAASGLPTFTVTFSEPINAAPPVTITRPATAPGTVTATPAAGCAAGAAATVLTCTYTIGGAGGPNLAVGDVITIAAGSYTDLSANPGLGASATATADVTRPTVISATATTTAVAPASITVGGLVVNSTTSGSGGNANTLQILTGTFGTAPTVTATPNAFGGRNIVVTLGASGNTEATIAAAIQAAVPGFSAAGTSTLVTVAVPAAPFTGGISRQTLLVSFSEPVTAPGSVTLDVNGNNIIEPPADATLGAPASLVGANAVYLLQSGGGALLPGYQAVLAVPIPGLSKVQTAGAIDPSLNTAVPAIVPVTGT